MKKLIVTLVLALFAFGAKSAFSQANFTLRADVPFAFSIQDHHYAAGSYELRTINGSTVRLLNLETGGASLVSLISSRHAGSGWDKAAPLLRFVRNGESAYLISLTDGSGNGWNVPVVSKDMGSAYARAPASFGSSRIYGLGNIHLTATADGNTLPASQSTNIVVALK